MAYIVKSRKAKQRKRGSHCLEHRLRIQRRTRTCHPSGRRKIPVCHHTAVTGMYI